MQHENIDQKIQHYQREVLKIKMQIFSMQIIRFLPIITLILAAVLNKFIWILLLVSLVLIYINWILRKIHSKLSHKKFIYEMTCMAYRVANGEKFKQGTIENEKFIQLGDILKND
jgi:hypothetical protein